MNRPIFLDYPETGGDNTGTTFAGTVSGAGGLTKAGTGTFTLSGNNTYAGTTAVQDGKLVAASNTALGSNAGGTVVNPVGGGAQPPELTLHRAGRIVHVIDVNGGLP